MLSGIDEVIAATARTNHEHQKLVLGFVPGWLVVRVRPRGSQIDGFRHTIDRFAVRHIKNRYVEASIEMSRRQLAVADGDIRNIPSVLEAPDQLIFGRFSPRGQALIGYVKYSADGSILYLEEVRTGRWELAGASMRKYPAGTLSSSIAATLESNGRTDGGNRLDKVDMAANVTGIRGSW